MAAKIYTTKDAPIAPLKKKTLAVIGFGSQGHAHALNLKDSGLKVIIGLYAGSKSKAVAEQHGFEVFDTAEVPRLLLDGLFDTPVAGWTDDLPDGRYELKLPYSNSRELLMDVLRYGADAEVVAPVSLREEMKIMLQLALGAYQTPAP